MNLSSHIRLFTTSLLALMVLSTQAQRPMRQIDPEKEEKDNLYQSEQGSSLDNRFLFGGNFWLSFWGGSTSLFLQPQLAYKLTERNFVGGGITYMYWSQSFITNSGQKQTYTDNAFGMNIFDRHRLLGPLLAHVEFSTLNFNSYNLLGEQKRIWSNSIYLGGVYGNSTSGRGAYLMILYDILWRAYTPTDPSAFNPNFFATPWVFRMGVFL